MKRDRDRSEQSTQKLVSVRMIALRDNRMSSQRVIRSPQVDFEVEIASTT